MIPLRSSLMELFKLHAWHKRVTSGEKTWLPVPALSLKTIATLIPNLQIDTWIRSRLTCLGKRFINKELAPFSHLQNQFNLPKGDVYNIYQCGSGCWARSIVPPLDGKRKKLPAQLKWERDLYKTLSDKDWDIIFCLCFKISKCINQSEIFNKFVQRAYFTPERRHKIWPSTSKYCWWNCGCIGDIFHG